MNCLRRLRLLFALLAGAVLLSACDFDVYQLPLPGGTDTGEDPIIVTVQFTDVLDLVPQSTVKVNDVNVGKVTDVELNGYTAEVTLELQRDIRLPDNAVAEIRQTSLLGEKFVQLEPPPEGSSANALASGDNIPLERSGRNPEVEEVLGALSLLLNGGGVAQIKTIATEINLALEGREDSARSVLTQVETLTTQLAQNKSDIVAAIESLNRLSVGAREQIGSIDNALEELPSALDSINRQRDDLVKMLDSLNQLSGVGVRVIKASKESTIATVRQLQPVLTEFANAGDAFVDSFSVILTYPFVDEVVGRDPQVARSLHMGDYANLGVNLQLDLTQLPGIPCAEFPDKKLRDLCEALNGNLGDLVRCVGLNPQDPVGLAECLQELLGDDATDAVCVVLPLPGLCPENGGGGTGGGGNGGVPQLPRLPGLPGLPDLGLGGQNDESGKSGKSGQDLLGGLGGLGLRPGFGPVEKSGDSGVTVTMGQLMETYDPALVSVLAGPLAVSSR